MDLLRSHYRRISLAESADFALGECRVGPSTRTISGPLGEARVEPRVMQLLLALHGAERRVLGREELLDTVWDGRIVGDDAINRAVGELRRALAKAGSSWEVETVARVGYRLKGPAGETAIAKPAAHAMPGITRRRVLGATMAVGVAAAALGGFALIRRRNAAQAELDELAHDIRTEIFTTTPASLERGEALLGEAAVLGLEEARQFGLEALLQAHRSDMLVANERVEFNRLAAAAIDRALSADPAQADARVAQAMMRRGLDNWAEHEANLRRILADEPDSVAAMAELGPFLQSVGRSTEARMLNLRSAELYPMGAMLQQRRALIHWIFGMNEEAVRIITRAGEIWPDHRLIAVSHLMLLAMTGRTASALTFLDDPVSQARLALPPIAIETWRTALDALEGRVQMDDAAATLVRTAMASPGLAANCTMLLSHMGFADPAYLVAERLVLGMVETGGGGGVDAAYSDPRWRETQWLFSPAARTIREDERFTSFAGALGYLDYWRSSGNWPDEELRGSLRIA